MTVVMAKRHSDMPLGGSEKKRKHSSLTITQKVELLKKLDRGVPVRQLTEEYGVGTTTVYDVKKQKEKLFKFYSDSDDRKAMECRKTMHRAQNEDVDRVLMEWIRQRRSEGVPLNGLMIMKQAKKFHEDLNIQGDCQYSEGWLQKFKKRHGIKYLKICGEKASADHVAAENYVGEFASIVANENLSPEQIYNADETALYWRYVPRKTLTTADEKAPPGFKDAKDRLTILACANAAGSHKVKLAVIGKSQHPRCLKGVRNLPVKYYANKKAWVTRELFTDWFNSHFVPAARAHCSEVGLDENCKIVLFLDNCSAHPPAELLVKNNVCCMYLPPNVTSILQPCDQGILRSMKCKYKNNFMTCMLAAVNRGEGITDFLKQFSIKDAMYAIANAWNCVEKSTLTNAWHRLWPKTVFEDEEDDEDDFVGFPAVSDETEIVNSLITYAKIIPDDCVSKLEAADIEEMLNVDKDVPVVHSLSDAEIAGMILNPDKDGDDSEDDDGEQEKSENVSINDMVAMCDKLIAGLEQRSFISAREVMSVYAIKETLLRQKPKPKQVTLEQAFKNAICRAATSELNPVPGPSQDVRRDPRVSSKALVSSDNGSGGDNGGGRSDNSDGDNDDAS